ncbi:MAG: DUF721 domain-containing protein [Parcubacteria group bacterium]|nr:DUF721 domain-containing protein [Parcubacteria group bacterium]
MFQPLKSFLSMAMQRKDIRDGVRTSVIIDAAREIIEEFFPAEVAARVTPRSFKNGTLTLGVKNSLVAQEVKLRSHALLEELADRFKDRSIRRVRIALDPSRQDEEGVLR